MGIWGEALARAVGKRAPWAVPRIRDLREGLLKAAVVLLLWAGGAVAASAACDVTTGSTSGVTISFSGSGPGNQVGFCVSNETVKWGLYRDQNIDAYNNFP